MKPHDENEDGLLEHAHPASPENPFDPDAHEVVPTPELIEEAASESHHGVIREEVEPDRKIGREEEAKLALENTTISRATGWFLTIAFLLTIFSVPIVQSVLEVKEGQATATGALPRAFDALQELPSWEQVRHVSNWSEAWALLPDADRLKTHEETMEDDSFFSQWLLPRATGVLLHAGVGNEQVYLGGRDPRGSRWLFYRPDVDYLTSKGFLDPSLLRVRARAGDASNAAAQPDPIKAIVDFHEQLAARNIALIVMPMTVKPMLEPEHLLARAGTDVAGLQNPSYSQFLKKLESSGVRVFDPTPILRARKAQTGGAQFLQTDTHWTPDAMQNVARELAAAIAQKADLSPTVAKYSVRRKNVQNLGDTAGMLTLPVNQRDFGPQSVQIEQVLDASGALWRSDKNCEVLLLGDSFCNIYSLGGMGWGEGAGFGAQLSRFLQRPVDAIVINAGGSHTSRQRLVGEMKRDPKRLTGKKVVVWEFSMRDLLIGDWKIFQLPQ